jgi:hypothetical protein
MIDVNTVLAIVSAALTIIGVVAGTKYQQFKNKANLFSKLIDQLVDAIEDDTITQEEFEAIVETVLAIKEGLS